MLYSLHKNTQGEKQQQPLLQALQVVRSIRLMRWASLWKEALQRWQARQWWRSMGTSWVLPWGRWRQSGFWKGLRKGRLTVVTVVVHALQLALIQVLPPYMNALPPLLNLLPPSLQLLAKLVTPSCLEPLGPTQPLSRGPSFLGVHQPLLTGQGLQLLALPAPLDKQLLACLVSLVVQTVIGGG
jgi:hypothetical protein